MTELPALLAPERQLEERRVAMPGSDQRRQSSSAAWEQWAQ
jgi:hypothetical protein